MVANVTLALALGLLGIVLGPFLGIIVDRAVERERPEPEHRCQVCGHGFGIRSLIPVASWFGRCPTDPGHRNLRYPLTDIATAVTFAVAGMRFGWTWQLAPYLILFAALVVMSVIDAETHLLLDILTGPSLAIGLFLVLVLSGANDYSAGVWPAMTGAAVFGVFMFLAYRVYPPGLGFGDVKLAPTLGLFLGWLSTNPLGAVVLVIYAILFANLGAAIVGFVLRAIKKSGRGAEIPLGPFLTLGTVVLIVMSNQVLATS